MHMTTRSLSTLMAGALIVGVASPALAQTAPRRAAPRMSCAAQLRAVRAAWEQMPASDTKNQVAAAYNEANHARRAGDERGCLAAISQVQLQR
jgi:hypothetical protein